MALYKHTCFNRLARTTLTSPWSGRSSKPSLSSSGSLFHLQRYGSIIWRMSNGLTSRLIRYWAHIWNSLRLNHQKLQTYQDQNQEIAHPSSCQTAKISLTTDNQWLIRKGLWMRRPNKTSVNQDLVEGWKRVKTLSQSMCHQRGATSHSKKLTWKCQAPLDLTLASST